MSATNRSRIFRGKLEPLQLLAGVLALAAMICIDSALVMLVSALF